MKTNFLYLMLICVLCIAACESQDEVKSESATVTISVTDEEGKPLMGKTVCMYADAFPITYTNVIFGEHPIANDVLIATAETNSNGVVTFVIDGSELNNSFQRRFHVSVKEVDYQYDEGIRLLIRGGEMFSEKITAGVYNYEPDPDFDPNDDIAESPSDNHNHYLVIKSSDMVNEEWDCLFCIYSPTKFFDGDIWEFSMDIMADKNANIVTQLNYDMPGVFYSLNAIGTVPFTSEWTKYAESGTYNTGRQEGGDYICFRLNSLAEANNYYFDNISWKINGVEVITNGDFEGDIFSCFYYYIRSSMNELQQVSSDNIMEE